jgi:hypothetical protein
MRYELPRECRNKDCAIRRGTQGEVLIALATAPMRRLSSMLIRFLLLCKTNLLYSRYVSAGPHDRDAVQQRLLLYVYVPFCGF